MTMVAGREVQSAVAQRSVPTNLLRGNVNVLDVPGIQFPGGDENRVPVYDICATIRRKISNFLRIQGVTQTTFLRAIPSLLEIVGNYKAVN